MNIKELIKPLSKASSNNVPCVSIILPTHPFGNERQVDKPKLNDAIDSILIKIKLNYPEHFEEIKKLFGNIKDQIDFLHNDLGIGIFVSPYFSKWTKFSFPVKEIIYLGSSFRLKELIYNQSINKPYHFLSINSDKIRLFAGSGCKLIEIKDDNFPHLITDDYIYEKPFRGNSYINSLKSTEKDKSILEEKRLQSEFKKVDLLIKKYLNGNPLFISGVKKETGYFNKISNNKKNLAGIIDGNFTKGDNYVPVNKVYEEVVSWMNMKEDELLDDLSDAFGKRQVASGLEEVAHAAKNGMGMDLFVEKDFECEGYISDSTGILTRFRPTERHQYLPDAVDYIIATVLSKNGKIHIVGNNKLDLHDKIALKLRYRRSEY